MLRRSLLQFVASCGLAAVAAYSLCGVYSAAAGAAEPPPPAPKETYIPDPEIESLIERTADRDSAAAKKALEQLVAIGPAAERAVNVHLQNHAERDNRMRFAELAARLGKGRTAYRVTLELQPEGSGTLTLWSDRTLLAECGRRYDRMTGAPERTYTDDDLRQNSYSKVELIKFMDEGMKHLEARVDMAKGAIETVGLLSFKSFESFAKFAEGFDPGGFYMLNGATLFDTEPGVRAYRFRKGREVNRDLYARNLLLFYPVRWEFVLDCKGKVKSSNATRSEGGKLIWSFDVCQMLRGEAQIEVLFDAAGLPLRPAPKDDQAVALPSTIAQLPVAIPAKKLIHARASKKSGSWQELVEHHQLVELDGRNSIGHDGPLQFRWAQTFGADLKLSAEKLGQDRIGMRIPEPGEYRFELTVTCNGMASKPEEVVVIVDPETSDKPFNETVASADPPPVSPPKTAPHESTPPTPKTSVASTEPRKTETPAPAPPKTEPPARPETPQIAAVKTDPTKASDTTETKPKPVPIPVEVKLDPAKSKELHAQAVKLMKAGNYKDAKPLLNDAVASDPKNWDAVLDFGITLMELGDLQIAMLKFEDAANNSDNAEALMYAGHCSARAGAAIDAGQWYRRGISMGGDKVAWEYSWQFGALQLAEKEYSSALNYLQDAEKDATKAKVNDYRLHRDLAIALHNLQQDEAALKHLKAMQDLGYTPDAQLLADVTKGTGGAAPKTVADTAPKSVSPDTAPTQKIEPPAAPKTDPVKTETVKTEPKVDPVPPKNVDTAQKPETTPAPAPKVDPAKIASSDPPAVSPSNPPKTQKTEPAPVTPSNPKTQTTQPEKHAISANETKPAVPAIPATPTQPEKTKAEKRADARPVYPKKALPPIPRDFDGCMAAGKHAYQDALGHVTLKSDEDKIKAAQSFDEAEAMYRGAWALRPGDETVIAAFRELAEYIGAVALVKNTSLKTKVKGMVVLDASASIAPKDRPLYIVWEQTAGENQNIRREDLTEKQLSLKIRTPGVYKFELAVSDGVRGGNPVAVTVEVEE